MTVGNPAGAVGGDEQERGEREASSIPDERASAHAGARRAVSYGTPAPPPATSLAAAGGNEARAPVVAPPRPNPPTRVSKAWVRAQADARPPKPMAPLRVILGATATLVAVAAVGATDHATGGYGFSLFYLAPIVIAGWTLGSSVAVLGALAATAAWVYGETHGVDPTADVPMTIWNGTTRAVIFTALGLLTARFRFDRDRLGRLNRRLEELVQREATLARTDLATGLPNARAFLEHLGSEISRCRRRRQPLCVAYIDLDHFKRVNDTRGHAEGDQLLASVAEVLRETFRTSDTPARIGGDEFAVLFSDLRLGSLEHIAHRFVDRIDEVVAAAYPALGVGASVGMAYFDRPPTDPEIVLRWADAAMYQAKSRGKRQVVIWTNPDLVPANASTES